MLKKPPKEVLGIGIRDDRDLRQFALTIIVVVVIVAAIAVVVQWGR